MAKNLRGEIMTITLTKTVIAIILLIIAAVIIFVKEGRIPNPTELILFAIAILLL